MANHGRIRPLKPYLASPPVGPGSWSLPLGQWKGVHISVHVSLAVALVLAVCGCVAMGDSLAWLALVVYLVSLGLHEAAHIAASARYGPLRPADDSVLLGPVGGLRVVGCSVDPREHVFTAMAGPMANLAVVVASMCCLAVADAPMVGSLLLDPTIALQSTEPNPVPVTTLARLLVAINWPLFLLNMAPAAPFDGGVALRSWLSLWVTPSQARDGVCGLALLVAAALCGAAVALAATGAVSAVACGAFGVMATVIFFGARNDAAIAAAVRQTDYSGDDFAGLSLSDLPRKRTRATSHDEELDEPYEDRWDESRVDSILKKVHAHGMVELTANERAILERASQIYQRRLSQD